VTTRHFILGILAAAVLVAGVYLFLEVRSTPVVAAQPVTPHHEAEASAPSAEERHESARTPGANDHRFAAGGMHMPAPPPTVQGSDEPSSEETAAQLDRPNPKIDAIMDQANKHYDKGEWEDAKLIAAKVLAQQPTNIRMMRIMVSASCVDGDSGVAQKWFDQLPKVDREQMKVRCDKYGVSFKEPAQ
jgi:hypothetical protein